MLLKMRNCDGRCRREPARTLRHGAGAAVVGFGEWPPLSHLVASPLPSMVEFLNSLAQCVVPVQSRR